MQTCTHPNVSTLEECDRSCRQVERRMTFLQQIFSEKERVRGNQLIFVLDGAREHGPEKNMQDLWRSKHPELERYLSSLGGDVGVIKAFLNLPQVSLCEYYNSTIRLKANAILQNSRPSFLFFMGTRQYVPLKFQSLSLLLSDRDAHPIRTFAAVFITGIHL